jgi:hypothetical protein
MFNNRKPAATSPAQPATPPLPPPARANPAGRGYLHRPATSAASRLAPPPPLPGQTPPADTLRRLDPQLADLTDAHTAADRDYTTALRAVENATPPGGPDYRAAVDQDTAAVHAGHAPQPAASRVAALLAGETERTAALVLAAAHATAAHAALIASAGHATTTRDQAEHELDAWVEAAVERLHRAVRNRDAAELAALDQQQQQQYPQLRAVWVWLADPRQPYRVSTAGVDQRLANAIVNNNQAISEIVGARRDGLYSQYATLQLGDSGTQVYR